MAENYEWLNEIARGFGLEGYGQLNKAARSLILNTRPGTELNDQALVFCNATKNPNEPEFTPEDIHEVFTLMALGMDKAAKKYGEIMEDYDVFYAVGDPPRAHKAMYYDVEEDSLVTTFSVIKSHANDIKRYRNQISGRTGNVSLGVTTTPEEVVVYETFQAAYNAAQAKGPENDMVFDERKIQNDRRQAAREFVEEMLENQYVGKLMAAAGHQFQSVDFGRQQSEYKSK